MKILFVHDHIFLTKDGKVYANSFSYQILKRYVDVFSEVTVLARHYEVADNEKIDLPLASGEGISFIFLESISSINSFFGLRRRQKKRIEKIVEAHDAVIVRLPSELGLMTAKVAERMHKKYMVEVVGCAWDALWNLGGWKAKIYAPVLHMNVKRAVRKADYITYVSKDFLQKRYPPSAKARFVGVSDVQLLDADEMTLSQRIKKIEMMDEKRIYGTIGNLYVGYKGIGVAIKMLAEVQHISHDFEYHVLGAGDPVEFRAMAERLGIGDKIFFDGVLPEGEAVYDWLDKLDVYLQPSFQEGLPRALVEAMSRGCPSIGSSAGGIPELLDRKMIFDHKKPKHFTDIVERLFQDKQLMKNTAKHNFSKALEYQKKYLDEERITFWMKFRDDTKVGGSRF